jgi:hypothetical protein
MGAEHPKGFGVMRLVPRGVDACISHFERILMDLVYRRKVADFTIAWHGASCPLIRHYLRFDIRIVNLLCFRQNWKNGPLKSATIRGELQANAQLSEAHECRPFARDGDPLQARMNFLAGDNGLGKTVLLEAARTRRKESRWAEDSTARFRATTKLSGRGPAEPFTPRNDR